MTFDELAPYQTLLLLIIVVVIFLLVWRQWRDSPFSRILRKSHDAFCPWRITEIAACKLRNVPAEELLEVQLQFKDAFLEIPSVDSLSTAYLLRINIQETLEHYMEVKKDTPKLGVEEFFAGIAGICEEAHEKRRTK